jgi:uncharacterized protein with GYD domain
VATYVLINFAEQGVKNVMDTANRASRYNEIAAKLGCTVKEIWWTEGQYDVVSIIEAPDGALATALAMSVGTLGYVRTQAMRAYSASEVALNMEKVVLGAAGALPKE